MSGGELQKVVIARALAQEPKILLLDEPTNNLDLKNQIELMDILRRIAEERKISAILTMHDLNLASIYADRIIMVKNGRIVANGGSEVLNEKNIRQVYGISVSVFEKDGKRLIVPVRC
ncbi:hypothetical protein Asulf_00420 [Archaeoglobus sulfaticallidus PM70-1]|uniref:ABC transporter domain-containing protein n=1 Tax=Archaeoglobus sulfaticallidus PM70-1 TaxID=387631 RepID=N0BDZ7_9EURY|nr:ABC transporter ATP-binding protein [Archaeoglobus sulfaticallidus]AGK60447.1 hypothetical protein Asulf_00420 [Archaeoglobus sulfaticallidus PM70-1]